MKKLVKIFMTAGLLLTIAVGVQGHIHDANCGYDEATQSGCIYEISPFNSDHMGC